MSQFSSPENTLSSDAILFDRECTGLRIQMLMRFIFVSVLAVTHWIVGVSLFEKLAATLLSAGGLVFIAICYWFVRQGRAIRKVGLFGSLLDIAILSTLPFLWYYSVSALDNVGEDGLAYAYMLKTQVLPSAFGLLMLNALAVHPLYPLIFLIGSLLLHAVLIAIVLNDPRSILSSNFVDTQMGPALSMELVYTGLLVLTFVGLALVYLTHAARRTVEEAVRLESKSNQLSRYFSPGIVAELSQQDNTNLAAQGRQQEVAVMFCDIRNFTQISEAWSPADIVAFLREYHARMVEVVFAHQGTIDKFVGDGILVTFGTPNSRPDDAERAVRAGIAMNAALSALNQQRKQQGLAAIRHGIAIHYGPVIAGNVGTPQRLEYTVIGDTVNVAARIQELCKNLRQPFLISKAVADRLPRDIRLHPLDEQHVRGRRAPVQLFALPSSDEVIS